MIKPITSLIMMQLQYVSTYFHLVKEQQSSFLSLFFDRADSFYLWRTSITENKKYTRQVNDNVKRLKEEFVHMEIFQSFKNLM